MRKCLKNEKGFTLIELLAVIVILGILMIVAIPMVTRYIEQARKDTFVDTAKAYINAARYAYLNDDLGCTSGDSATVPFKKLEVDNAGKSPFGGDLVGYVVIKATVNDTEGTGGIGTSSAKYYVVAQDQNKKWGIARTEEGKLERKSVEKLKTDVSEPGDVSCTAIE